VDAQLYTPVHPQNTRLNEIVARIGEICLSPELAHVMLFPGYALAYASSPHWQGCHNSPSSTEATLQVKDFPQTCRELCYDPTCILLAMDESDPTISHYLSQAGKFISKFQSDCLPIPITTTSHQPIHVCAWKLESPARVCLYTGENLPSMASVETATFSPHTISKILREERSKRPTPSRIHLVTQDDLSPNAIRASLLHYAQTALTSQGECIQENHALDHTIEEAVACLIHAPTSNHTQTKLNQSPPWDKHDIDSRSSNPHCNCGTLHANR
jgi:hypothetical protein